jgi:hypothetical protein|tara:strand:- start:31 stop:528 length:498 start_codon:yes stop_codon:yes gene_type:complete
MNVYDIHDVAEIAKAIKSGDSFENDMGTVINGFFWFPDEMQWAAQWQKEEKQDSPDGYFAMLLDPNVFEDTDDVDEIMAGIEYWWHRSQIYSAAYLINTRPVIESGYTEDLAKKSLQELLVMQKEVKDGLKERGINTEDKNNPKMMWNVVRTTAQHIHNNVRGVH